MALVRDIMSRNVSTLGRNDKLSAVGDLMKVGRIRHMPILDEQGGVVRIVSQRDLFLSGLVRALGFGTSATEKVLDSLLVKEVMTKDVITATPHTPPPGCGRPNTRLTLRRCGRGMLATANIPTRTPHRVLEIDRARWWPQGTRGASGKTTTSENDQGLSSSRNCSRSSITSPRLGRPVAT